ncbi:hypothetical protein, partial [Paraburkholderia kirstenboschensis]|uniref:hypothetical protein n=1 Tax=Paraburkholderia kirstenboschensis TaxID=1245436 RepID=UPI001F2EA5AB
TAWSEQWPTHAPMNPVMLPWQEWLRRMESTAAGMAYGSAWLQACSTMRTGHLFARPTMPYMPR